MLMEFLLQLFFSYFTINVINLMALSRRVRVSRIKSVKYYACHWQQKEYFSLLSNSGYVKPEYWPGATKGESNLARRKKTKRISTR